MTRACSRFILLPVVYFLFGFSAVAVADLPAFYGENFARMGSEWPDASPRGEISTWSPAKAMPHTAYERQIADFESHDGPYANTLSEPLLGLGRYYASRGDHEVAVGIYRRALHIVRLNDGLYSEMQAPIVRELLNTIRVTGDFEGLDDRYDYFFRLYGNGEPPHTDIRLRAAVEYLRWQREALRLGFDSRYKQRLLKAYTLNESLLNSGQIMGYKSAEDQWKLALGQIRNLYLLQSKVSPRIVVSNNGSLFHAVAAQEGEVDFEQRHLETLQRNALERGRLVLEQSLNTSYGVADTSDNELERRARVLLELGDWHQWNGSYRRAREYYAQVERVLDDAGREELLQSWLGSPVELPDNGAFWQPPVLAEGEGRAAVSVTFDVSSRGRVKNISIEANSSTEQGKVYRFKRELGRTQFRPRYHNGQAVPAQVLSREYELYD